MSSTSKPRITPSLFSGECTSLRSSRMNMASVASEFEYNNENASIDSLEDVNAKAINLKPRVDQL